MSGRDPRRRPVRRLLLIHLGAAAVLILYLLLTGPGGFGCPIRALCGIPCPGCGLSRAWLCALRLDLAGAFAYHPLFWLIPPLLFLAFHRGTPMLRRLPAPLSDGLLIGGGALLLLCWLLRLAGPGIP